MSLKKYTINPGLLLSSGGEGLTAEEAAVLVAAKHFVEKRTGYRSAMHSGVGKKLREAVEALPSNTFREVTNGGRTFGEVSNGS